MSRIRTIKPEFWVSEQVVACSLPARLLFIGIWNFADDNGVIPASAKQLKMQIFPGDDFTATQVQAMVNELLAQSLLAEFEHECRHYWYVTGWRHQKIDKPNPKFPPPPKVAEHSTTVPRTVGEELPTGNRSFGEKSLAEGKGRDSNLGKEGKEGEKTITAPDGADIDKPAYPPEFEQTWKIYPARSGGNSKPTAYSAWKARRKEGATAEALHAGTQRYAAFCEATGKLGTEYVKQACTFFGPGQHFREAWKIPSRRPANAAGQSTGENGAWLNLTGLGKEGAVTARSAMELLRRDGLLPTPEGTH